MSGTADRPPVGVLDAVCCVHFCGANKHSILLEILNLLDLRILVPAEVSDEVVSKDSKFPGLALRWKKLIVSDRVTILPRLLLDDPAQSSVVSRVAALRSSPATAALRTRKDLGEFVVIAHAADMKERGRTVYVLLDDGAAQRMATAEGLDVIDMQQLLSFGHRQGIDALTTKAKLKAVYDALRKYGESLPPWNASRVKAEL